MKNKGTLITTIIFFLIVNSAYYWEGILGFFAIPVFMILVVIYLGLAIALARQVYFAVKEKFKNKYRLLQIGLLTSVLTLTFVKPNGIINFNIFEGNNILIAEREGAANCMTTLMLKDDYTFKEKKVCFGITEIKGNFRIQNDTIYFDNVNLSRHGNEYYKFAIIKSSKYENSKIIEDFIRYKDLQDKTGNQLWITKNELDKIKSIKPTYK